MITCTFENGNQNSLRHVTGNCLVIKDGQLLLEKRSKGLLEAGKWGLVGGYIERDETVEEGVIREALEETGWVINNLVLLRVNDSPNRPHEDRQNIELVYFGDAIKKTGDADWESEEVKWFPLDELPADDQIAFDHADNIKLYKQHRENPLALPITGRLQA